jgi:Tfp pilus assembly protein PilZ
MEKLGMWFVKTGTFYEQTLVQYAITKEVFLAQDTKLIL